MPVRILDLPTGMDDVTLADAFVVLKDLYDRVDEHAARLAAPLELPCHPGCSSCCRQSVFVTPLEALYLLSHLQETRSPSEVTAVVDAGVATFNAHRERILAFGHPTCPGAPELGDDDARRRAAPLDRVLSALALSFDCPLLDSAGLCSVYPAREMRGRLFAVSRLKSRDEYYACNLLGRHLDGREVRLMDAEAVVELLHLHPLTDGEQVIPYYLWRYASLLR
ncbi:MAG: hypothetical protein AB2A00_41430 [Myxococcota bacterium]